MEKWTNPLKYILSFAIAGLFAWIAFLDFSLWIEPPVGISKENSIELLKSGIVEKGLFKGLNGIAVLGMILFFNWLISSIVDNQKKTKELIVIALICILIISIGIGLGMLNAYNGLLSEINYN